MIKKFTVSTWFCLLLLVIPNASDASIKTVVELFPSTTMAASDFKDWEKDTASSSEKELLANISLNPVSSLRLPKVKIFEGHFTTKNRSFVPDSVGAFYELNYPLGIPLVGAQFLYLELDGLSNGCLEGINLETYESVFNKGSKETMKSRISTAPKGAISEIVRKPKNYFSNYHYILNRVFGLNADYIFTRVDKPDFKIQKVLLADPFWLRASLSLVFDLGMSVSSKDYINLRVDTAAGTKLVTVTERYFKVRNDRIEIPTSHVYSELERVTKLGKNEVVRSARIREFIIHKKKRNALDGGVDSSPFETIDGGNQYAEKVFDLNDVSISYREAAPDEKTSGFTIQGTKIFLPAKTIQGLNGTRLLWDFTSMWNKLGLEAKSIEIKIKKNNGEAEECNIEKVTLSGFNAEKTGAVDLDEAYREISQLQVKQPLLSSQTSYISLNIHSNATWEIDADLNLFSNFHYPPAKQSVQPISIIVNPDLFSQKIDRVELIQLISTHEQFNDKFDDILMFFDKNGHVLTYDLSKGIIKFDGLVEIETLRVNTTKFGKSKRETFDTLIISPFFGSKSDSWGLVDIRSDCIRSNLEARSRTFELNGKGEDYRKSNARLDNDLVCGSEIFDSIKGIIVKKLNAKPKQGKPECVSVYSKTFKDAISPQIVCFGARPVFFLPIKEPYLLQRSEALGLIGSLIFEEPRKSSEDKAKVSYVFDHEFEFTLLGFHSSKAEDLIAKAVALSINEKNHKLLKLDDVNSYADLSNDFLLRSDIDMRSLLLDDPTVTFGNIKLIRRYKSLSWLERHKTITLKWVGLYKTN